MHDTTFFTERHPQNGPDTPNSSSFVRRRLSGREEYLRGVCACTIFKNTNRKVIPTHAQRQPPSQPSRGEQRPDHTPSKTLVHGALQDKARPSLGGPAAWVVGCPPLEALDQCPRMDFRWGAFSVSLSLLRAPFGGNGRCSHSDGWVRPPVRGLGTAPLSQVNIMVDRPISKVSI